MSGFLDEMAESSGRRVAAAMRVESFADLERRARAAAPGPGLRLSTAGFDVIAELKLRSPAAGVLRDGAENWLGRVAEYARGGAAAVSVLTEPTRFDGSLEHLRQAAAVLAPLGVPVMRKDFIVDPYQILEARAAGAGGILLILRMLPPVRVAELLAVAAEYGLFVLLEAFDAEDLSVAHALLSDRVVQVDAPVLVGINCRDLQTLAVVPERFAELAAVLPTHWPVVAESGVATASDARRMRDLGYGLALIGTALMTRDEPAELLREIFAATRTVES